MLLQRIRISSPLNVTNQMKRHGEGSLHTQVNRLQVSWAVNIRTDKHVSAFIVEVLFNCDSMTNVKMPNSIAWEIEI